MSTARLAVWPRRVVRASSAMVCLAGLLGLIGWTFRIDALTSILPDLPNMAAGTALGFGLMGIGLWCVGPGRASLDLPFEAEGKTWRRISRLCAGTAIVLGALRLISYLTGVDFGLDQLWFTHLTPKSIISRISPATATNFIVLGLGLYAAGTSRWFRLVQILALSGGLLGWLGFSRYLFGGQPILPFTQMAVHTAISFIALSIGLLCLRDDAGLVALLVSEGPGGTIARRLVPSALLVPFVVGWLVLKGEHVGWLGIEAGIELFALVNVVVFGGLIWANAFHLHNAEMEREHAWESLRFSKESLSSSQAKLQGIVSSAMDAIVSVDEQQKIVLFNRAAEVMFQCAASEAIGSTLDSFIPKRLREVHREHIRRFATRGVTSRSMISPGILIAIRANGEEFPIEATISQVQADGEQLYTVILRDITERKRAEEALSKQAEVLRLRVAALDAAANSIVMTDAKGTIQWVNAAFTKLTGYSAAEAIGQNPRVLKSGKHDDRFYKNMWSTILSGSTWRGEVINRRKDESLYVEEMTITPICSADGRVNNFLAVKEDITAQKKVEEALQESEERLRLFVEHAPAALAMFDHEMRYLSVSRRWLADHGLGDYNVLGLSHYEVFPEVSDQWKSDHRRGLAGEVLGEEADRFVRADGSVQWLSWEIRPWYDKRGEVGGIVIFTVDITVRKQAEAALRASEQRWATTLQSIGDAVISTDATGNIEFINEVAERLTGWSLAEAKGRDLNDIFNIVQEVTRIKPENSVAKVIRLGKVAGLADHHTTLIRRDGTEIPIEESGAPIRNREGQIEGVVLVIHDVSEQRKVEKALRDSDRLATTGRLAATIAHEIHNPLDAVGGLLYLIGQSTREDTTREYVSMASQELVRTTQMTQQMLTFQREAANPLPVKIGEILDSVIALYDKKIRSAGINLKQQIEFDGQILALPGELRQAFANLVGNAIEAMGSRHGTITLRAYASRDWRDDRPGLRVVVADDGPGIPASVRTSIFEPFFTTKGEGGTGLGLWITSDILRKYDGIIRLRTSTQSQRSGTCFSVFFPFEASSDLPSHPDVRQPRR